MPTLAATGAPFLPLLFLLPFFWLSLAIGRRLLIWLGTSRGGTLAERALVGVALGVSTLQLVPLTLGAAGILSPRTVRALVGLIALVALPDLWAVARRAWSEFRWPHPRLWQLGWAVALSPAMIIALLMALVPTIDPDGLGYHLTVPKRWLENGSLAYLPTYSYSNAPMGVEMLFAIALSFVGDTGAKCLHFSLGILGAIGLVLAGKRLHGNMVGIVTATLFLIGPLGVGGLLGTAYIEGAVAFAMITAMLAWLVWFRSHEYNWLRCAALLAGVAVSFKITSALFPLAMSALTLIAIVTQPLDAAGRDRPAWTLLPLVAVPVLPWLVRAALITGNPFFPLFASWIPTRDLSPSSASTFDRHFRYWNWGTSLSADWTLERRRLLLIAVGAAVVIVGAWVFTRLRSPAARGSVLVFVGTVLAQVFAVGLYTRFWIALTSVLMLPIVAIFGRALSGRWVPATLVVVTAIASLAHARRAVDNIREVVRTAVGLDDRHKFLLRHMPLLPIDEYANRELPTWAGILLTYNCAGFYLNRTTFCDESIQDSFRWTTWDEFVADVRRLGVTHIVAPRVLAVGGVSPPIARTSLLSIHYEPHDQLLRRLLEKHAHLVTVAADQGLYVLEASITGQAR